jgi:glucose/arabinose dehydrogenase
VAPPAGQINLPPGFGISVFASGLDTPRNLAIGPDGQLYVAERGAGRIDRLPDRNHDGLSDGLEVIAQGLTSPSSLAFYKDGSLYVSTPTQVFRLSQPDANGIFQERELVIDGLPSRQGHFTRTLLFSPDWSSLFIQSGYDSGGASGRQLRVAPV